jgi:hypothetical protein
MIGLPASPRARRRLAYVSAAVAVLVAGVAVAFLVPGKDAQHDKVRGNEGPAQTAPPPRHYRLSAADRRGINAALDRFVPAAMERKDPEAGWALAGSELRSGSTLAAWRAGTSPVPFYVPRETTFHDWRTIEVDARSVILNVLMHPKNPAEPSYVFSVQMVKPRRQWLVNRIYTIAVMNPPTNTTDTTELGPADYAAPRSASSTPNRGPLLGHLGILPVVVILALVLMIPLGFGAIALVRARRWRRRVRTDGRSELPPLPSGYLREEREKTPSGR